MIAMRYGLARGLFSNESELDSTSIVAFATQIRNLVKQAFVFLTETLWDIVFICLMTGLVVVNTGN